MHAETDFPRITIITPSYNQGRYLAETIESVLNQNYPNLEYMIFDGGSTDDSPEIIRSYASSLAYYEIEKDRGQTHAINKGLERATGDIVAYMNSDDVYLPGAFATVSEHFQNNPSSRWLTGSCLHYGVEAPFMMTPRSQIEFRHMIDYCCIDQPSTFLRKDVIDQFGLFDEKRRFNMDYEYWLRLLSQGVGVDVIKYPLSAFRLHAVSKTVSEVTQSTDDELKDLYAEFFTEEMRKLNRLEVRQNWAIHAFEDLMPAEGAFLSRARLWSKGFKSSPKVGLSSRGLLALGRIFKPSRQPSRH